MKYFSVFLILLYQITLSPFLKNLFGVQRMCRFTPSCSEYTKQQIRKHGMIKGLARGWAQLSRCHPFAKAI